ncbi:hypothetical protein RJ641_011251, partial [Dillenia turbinata]
PMVSWPKISLLCYALLLSTLSLTALDHPATRRGKVVRTRNGVVAADDGRCSRIGRDALSQGGHAIDAAVATALCLGVVGPASSGIGGGDFLLVRLASGKVQAFDFRESAPMLASENMFTRNATRKATGALSIAVPGQLAGLHKVWKLYGKLPWKRLVRPAARLASGGFKITPYLHMQMVEVESRILADKGLRKTFAPNGKLLRPGDTCYNKKLGKTFRTIAKKGIEAFYNGSIGLKLVSDVQKLGGILKMEDLQSYQVKMREPVSSKIGGLKILGMPPPSSGGAVIALILNILAQFGGPLGVTDPLGFHRLVEALKHAFAARMNLGDPDFVDVSQVLSNMTSPKFARELKKKIHDNKTFDSSYYASRWNQIYDHGTSHISIVDSERNAVAMTCTVNAYFGSRLLSESTGIILNNEMDDFSIPENFRKECPPPAPANFIRPGKRPLSSMSPTIVLKDGQLKAVLGASGGVRIIAGTLEVFINHFLKGMDPISSVTAPRIYHQLFPNVVEYENLTTAYGDHFELPAGIRKDLQNKGHVLKSLPLGTMCQLILQKFRAVKGDGKITSSKLVAASDPRKGGYPAGY